MARLEECFEVPGHAAAVHSHWIFPVLTADPERLIEQLALAGFHATQGRSMCAIAAPADRPELQPLNAERLLRDGVFLPVYPELPEAEFDRLVGVILEIAGSPQRRFGPMATVTTAAPMVRQPSTNRLPNAVVPQR